MSIWIQVGLEVTGELHELERFTHKVNEMLKPVMNSDETVSHYVWEFSRMDLGDRWLEVRQPLRIEEGKIDVEAGGRYSPWDALAEISARHPSLTFEVSFRWDSHTGYRGRFARGEWRLLEDFDGAFLCRDGETYPVHHWRVWCESPEVRNCIRAAGLAEEFGWDDGEALTVRDLGALEPFAGQFEARPYTLDEELYVSDLQTALYHARLAAAGDGTRGGDVRQAEADLAELVWAAERDLTLTGPEVEALWGMVRDDERRLDCLGASHEALRSRVVYEWNEVEKERFRRYFAGETPEFHPTARELKRLLAASPNDRRRVELADALAAPRWTRRWPEWEHLARDHAERQARQGEGGTPRDQELNEKEFAEELERLADRPEG
jgi:hypothetical protein